jgi:hypothetical protein
MIEGARPFKGDEQRMRAYLLGGLTDEERAEVEARFFAEDEYFDGLLDVQYDLIDEYARGTLTPAERAQVEARLLSDTEGGRHLVVAEALRRMETRAAAAPATRRWYHNLRLAAALILATTATAVWLGLDNRQLRSELARSESAAQPPAASNQPERPPATTEPSVADLRLSPRVARSDSLPPVAQIQGQPQLVRVLLPLDEPVGAVAVAVEKAGAGRIWTQSEVTDRDGNAVVVWLPASLLGPGDYEFIVSREPNNPASLLATYHIRISR